MNVAQVMISKTSRFDAETVATAKRKLKICTKRLFLQGAEFVSNHVPTGSDKATSWDWILNQVLIVRESLQLYPFIAVTERAGVGTTATY